MLKEAGNGGHFIEPIAGLGHHIAGFAFVDVTDLIIVNMNYPLIIEWEMFEEIHGSIDRWQGVLWALGGAIVPEKSFGAIPLHSNSMIRGNGDTSQSKKLTTILQSKIIQGNYKTYLRNNTMRIPAHDEYI